MEPRPTEMASLLAFWLNVLHGEILVVEGWNLLKWRTAQPDDLQKLRGIHYGS